MQHEPVRTRRQDDCSECTTDLLHVLISLIGIATGLVVLFGMLRGSRMDGLTAVFLITTVLTSATGFFLPAPHFLPRTRSASFADRSWPSPSPRATFHMAGAWRRTYVITAVIALYFNVFVLVAQLFMKVARIEALAPTQSEPPFAIAQGAVLLIFIVLGTLAVRKFRVV